MFEFLFFKDLVTLSFFVGLLLFVFEKKVLLCWVLLQMILLMLGLQVACILGYVSSIMNLWLLLVSFIATNMALVTLFPNVWWVSPDTLEEMCGWYKFPHFWFWPCFPCAQRD